MKMNTKQNMHKKNVLPKPYHHQQLNQVVNYLTRRLHPNIFQALKDSSNSQNESNPDNSETTNTSNRPDDSCKVMIDDDVKSSQDSANVTKDLFNDKMDSSDEIQRNSEYCDKDK